MVITTIGRAPMSTRTKSPIFSKRAQELQRIAEQRQRVANQRQADRGAVGWAAALPRGIPGRRQRGSPCRSRPPGVDAGQCGKSGRSVLGVSTTVHPADRRLLTAACPGCRDRCIEATGHCNRDSPAPTAQVRVRTGPVWNCHPPPPRRATAGTAHGPVPHGSGQCDRLLDRVTESAASTDTRFCTIG